MKVIDMRFHLADIKSLVGKKFERYTCDPFLFSNSVTQNIGLFIDADVFILKNEQKEVDYFGEAEEMAVFQLLPAQERDVKSAFIDTEQIRTVVNQKITRIQLINEEQRVSDHEKILYDVFLTRGIIFFLEDREISFEKDQVPFSEEIFIQKGDHLISTFSDPERFKEDWEDAFTPECFREILDVTGDKVTVIRKY